MKKHRDLCSWISDNWIRISLFFAPSIFILISYVYKLAKDLSVIDIFLNLSFSILAAFIFHLIIDVIPNRKRTKIIRDRITRQFVRVKEEIRLCKSVLSPFDLDKCDSLNRYEYVAEFETLDLNTKYISKNGISRKQYLAEIQSRLELQLNQLLEYNEHLRIEELKVINDILDSDFLMNSIQPIDFDVPEQELHAYPNNQREIGESIYDISELIKQV